MAVRLTEKDEHRAARVERKQIRRARYERRMRRIDPQWGISVWGAAVDRTFGTPRVAGRLPQRRPRWKPRHSLHDPGFTASAREMLSQAFFGLQPVPHATFEPESHTVTAPAEPTWLERLGQRLAQVYA